MSLEQILYYYKLRSILFSPFDNWVRIKEKTMEPKIFVSRAGGNEPVAGYDYTGVGIGVLIVDENERLFLAKRGPGVRNEAGKWEFPGGGLEYGEKLEDAVVREMREEYGIEVEILLLLNVYNHILPAEHQHWVAVVYLCRLVSGVPQIQEDDKCTEIGWFTVDEIENMELTQVSLENFADYKLMMHGQF